MSRLQLCVTALFGFVPLAAAQSKGDALPPGAIARLGEVRYRNVGRAFSIAFSPDGKSLAAGAWDGSLRLWDVATGKEIRRFTGHHGWVRAVAFSPDGKLLASGGKDKIIHLWETATGRELRQLKGSQQWIEHLMFLADGKTLGSRSMSDGNVREPGGRLWDVSSGRELRRIEARMRFPFRGFSPNGKRLAYFHLTQGPPSLVLHDFATGKEMCQLDFVNNWLGNLIFSPDSKILAASGQEAASPYGHIIHLWDTTNGKLRPPPLGKLKSDVCGIEFSPDSRLLAAAETNRQIHVWEIITRQERCRFQTPDKKPSVLAISPDGRILAQASEDFSVLLWDLTGQMNQVRLQLIALSANELQSLWADLARTDGPAAWRAIWKMTAAPKESVSFIREHLRPTVPADTSVVSRLVSELDSPRFEIRTKATEKLEKMGDLAVPILREALRHKPELEKRRRIERLLDRVARERENPSPDRLRMLRVLETLERIDAPEARQALEQFAQGADGSDLTEQAKASLRRLVTKGNRAAPHR